MSATQIQTHQTLQNLRKLGEWEGCDLTSEFVEKCADGMVEMVWAMEGTKGFWADYLKVEGFKQEALEQVEEQLKVYPTCEALKWKVVGPSGCPTKVLKELKAKFELVPPALAVELFEKHKEQLLADAEAKLKPAPVKASGGGGKKTAYDGLDYIDGAEFPNVKNDEEKKRFDEALGVAGAKAVADDKAKFKFVGDEDRWIGKATINKERTKRTWRCLPVSSQRDLGAGSEDDAKCNGAIIWDKALKSKALVDAKMTASAFKIRCGKTATADGFCSGCAGKKLNFFTSKYALQKGASVAHNGKTFQEFFDELEVVEL
tara:strand:- start:158 stop:1108 length:951 start_codon:yes stop_codon:yes gene_type:complete